MYSGVIMIPLSEAECLLKGVCLEIIPSHGGGGFFLACEDLGRMFDNSFPVCVFFFFFKWR